MMMKKQNDKQKLFENMVKINPDLKNNDKIVNILNESIAPRLEEDHLNTKEDQLDFLMKVRGIMRGKEYSEEEAELLKVGWRELPDEKINAFYLDIEDQFKKRGIDPHTINEYDDYNEFDRAHQGERDVDAMLGFFMSNDLEFQSTTERIGSNSFEGSITYKPTNGGEQQYVWRYKPTFGQEVKLWNTNNDDTWERNNEIGSFPLDMWEYTKEDNILAIGEEIKNVIKNSGSLQEKFEVQSSNVELRMKNGKTIPVKLQDHGRNIIVGDYTIDEILDSVGQEDAIGNFKQPVTLYQYFDYLTHRQGGATEETFNNNRLFKVNLEHAVELFNRFSVEDGYDELMQEDISIDVKVGDTIMTGRFKNKRTVVKSIGKDENGMPTINGKKVVTFKKGVKDESVNETVETWQNDIAPSNQEHFAKQAQGLGISPQEMYDEMKAQEGGDDSRMSLNEAELSREDLMAALKAKFGLEHVDTTENFYRNTGEGIEGGIWLSGENGETASDGRELFYYYSTDYKNYDLGVHNELSKFLEDNGWYPEWNDPGTLMVINDSMEENKVLGESIDTGKKFVVVANQNYRGWSKKKGYMKTITTPTHDNSEYVLSDEISQEEARRMVDSIEGDEQWKNSGIVVYMVSADEIGDTPRPTRRRDPDEWMDYINEVGGEKFRAEVTGKGENRWSGNAMEYDTEEEAKEWLNNLANRWFGFDMSRVVPVSTPTGQPVDMENDIIHQNFRG